MANSIDITINISDDGTISVLDQTAAGLDKVGAAGSAAGGSGGGIGEFVSGMADLAMGAISVVQQVGAVVMEFDRLGNASLNATHGLDALSGGQADKYMKAAAESTAGLVDNLTLAGDASRALSAGVVNSSAGFAQLARDGAVLGTYFDGTAAQGVDDLTRSLESVGNVRSLRQLGIDATATKTEFDALKKSGEDVQTAWDTAVLDNAGATVTKLGGTADIAGGQVQRLTTQIDNLKAAAGEKVAVVIEATIDMFSRNSQQAKTASGTGIINDEGKPLTNQNVSGGSYDIFGGQGNYDVFSGNAVGNGKGYTDDAAAANQTQGVSPGRGGYGGTSAAEEAIKAEVAAREKLIEQLGVVSPNNRDLVKTDQIGDFLAQTGGILAAAQGQSDRRNSDRADGLNPYRFDSPGMQKAEIAEDLQKQKDTIGEIKTIGAGVAADAAQWKANVEGVVGPAAEIMAKYNGIKSINQAFGVTGDSYSAEVGQGLQGAVSAQEAAFAQKNKGQPDKIQAFDDSQRAIMDQYAIATGQATSASVLFKNTLSDLGTDAAAGKLPMADYSAELIAMGNAARQAAADGKALTQSDIFKMDLSSSSDRVRGQGLQGFEDSAGGLKSAFEGDPTQLSKMFGGNGVPAGGTSGASDPFKPVEDGSKAAASQVQSLKDSLAGMGVSAGIGAGLTNLAVSTMREPVALTETQLWALAVQHSVTVPVAAAIGATNVNTAVTSMHAPLQTAVDKAKELSSYLAQLSIVRVFVQFSSSGAPSGGQQSPN